MRETTDGNPKRPYAPPRLTVYGRLETVTLTNVTMNMTDMVSGRMT